EMIDWLALTGTERVLEIGTGSGCNAALLSCCAEKVYTVEYNHSLASSAREKLKEKGFENVDVVEGDGILGLPDEKPFDAIIVTAGLREIPKNLADQLNPHFGRMIAPVGEDPSHQNLVIITRIEGEFYVFKDKPVSFHPLMSEHRGGWTRESIDELKRNKTDFVIKMVEDCGRSEEELQEKITNICGKPPFSGSAC
ncbi:MAG: protein-L-isoaspartate O-methyltransferase, partial [bacterium]|nr:protein-L-isoaspartate O-methyltransferase [bacterium]